MSAVCETAVPGCIVIAIRTASQSPASINEDDIQLPSEPPGNCSKRLQVGVLCRHFHVLTSIKIWSHQDLKSIMAFAVDVM